MDYQYSTHLPIAPLTVPKSTDPWVGVLVSPGCCITNDPIVNTYNSTITKIQNKTDMGVTTGTHLLRIFLAISATIKDYLRKKMFLGGISII